MAIGGEVIDIVDGVTIITVPKGDANTGMAD